MDAEVPPGEARGDSSTLSLESDFNFDGLVVQAAEGLNDSDSDVTVDSDIEDAIMAQLYFRDVKSKKSGKRVSVAKQLGLSEVRLDHSSDGSAYTSISFVMDNQRKRKKRQHSPVDYSDSPTPHCSHGASDAAVEDASVALGSTCQQSSSDSSPFPHPQAKAVGAYVRCEGVGTCPSGWERRGEEGREERGGEEESRCDSIRKKYNLHRSPVTAGEGPSKQADESKQKHRWGRTVAAGRAVEAVVGETEEGRDPSDKEEFVGVREIEEWDDSSSSDDSHHSSDMELSDDPGDEGQLFLEVDEKDKWHIILKDVMGCDEYEKQYGGRSLGKKFRKCFNCKQKGHQYNSCPHPIRHQVCYVCSGYDHISSRCSGEYCTYCFQKKHKGKPCSAPWGRFTVCQRCYCHGHDESVCHEQWRQYHNTISLNLDGGGDSRMFRIVPSQQRQMRRVFCYNCGRSGHFGHECSKERPRGFALPLTPLIADYDEFKSPHTRKRKRHRRRKQQDPSGLERMESVPKLLLNRGRKDGLLETPTRPLLGHHHSKQLSNGYWKEQGTTIDSYRLQEYNRHSIGRDNHLLGRPRSQSSNYKHETTPGHNFPSPQTPLSQPPVQYQPFPPHPSFHPPATFSDSDDCQIIVIEEPQRTMSEPHRHRCAPERRFSLDPSHLRRNLCEEADFPRTPLPNSDIQQNRYSRDPHQNRDTQQFGSQNLLSPPTKLLRRESEPFSHRLNSNHSNTHDKLSYSHEAHNRPSQPTLDYRRTSTGYERGFRGSEHVISLMQSHREDKSHRRRSRYGNR